MKYFVVYAIRGKKHVVIPENWVFEHEIMIEKFVNYSINRNQKHLCYWSNKKNEKDEPHGEPNFIATCVPSHNNLLQTNKLSLISKVLNIKYPVSLFLDGCITLQVILKYRLFSNHPTFHTVKKMNL